MNEQLESKILAHFKKGGTLTVKTCWNKFSTSELRQYVSRINARSVHFIQGTWQQKGQKRFKSYWLHS